MARHIRVVAQPHDPVVLHRLVRVLIAQAQLEINQRRLKEEAGRRAAAGDSAA